MRIPQDLETRAIAHAVLAFLSEAQRRPRPFHRSPCVSILQSLPTGVISFDSNNKVTTINKSAVQILRLEDANFDGFELDGAG